MVSASRTWTCWGVGVAALLLLLGVALRLSTASGGLLLQVPWPTPPPGSPFSVPQQTGVGISISPPAEGPGSETMLVQSLWPGNLPLIPPVPQTTLVFKGRAGDPPLTLIVDAGAINLPIHLRFTPLEPAVVPPAWAGAEVVHAFRLEAFDMDGGRSEGLPVARPVKLRLPIALWADTDGQDSQLLLAALDREGDGWQPLITAYYPRLQELRARLLSFSQ